MAGNGNSITHILQEKNGDFSTATLELIYATAEFQIHKFLSITVTSFKRVTGKTVNFKILYEEAAVAKE